jgi:hypothetical protein
LSWLRNLTTDSFALVSVGCLLTPSRRCLSILLNSHTCPWVLYSRNNTSLRILPWTCILMMNQWLPIPSTQTLQQSMWHYLCWAFCWY